MAAGGEPVETREDSLENNSVLTVLSKGDTIHYIVPSFPVYSAELVEIKDNGRTKMEVYSCSTPSPESVTCSTINYPR